MGLDIDIYVVETEYFEKTYSEKYNPEKRVYTLRDYLFLGDYDNVGGCKKSIIKIGHFNNDGWDLCRRIEKHFDDEYKDEYYRIKGRDEDYHNHYKEVFPNSYTHVSVDELLLLLKSDLHEFFNETSKIKIDMDSEDSLGVDLSTLTDYMLKFHHPYMLTYFRNMTELITRLHQYCDKIKNNSMMLIISCDW